MKVELKEIIDQLTDVVNLAENFKVSAIIDKDKVVGWTIVEVSRDGTITPLEDYHFNTIGDLLHYLYVG